MNNKREIQRQKKHIEWLINRIEYLEKQVSDYRKVSKRHKERTNWGAEDLPAIVKTALAKRWRWDDAEYLARIVFDVMTDGNHGQETGFGIGSEHHGDVWRVVHLDCSNKTVQIEDHGKPGDIIGFKDYI